MLYKTLYCVEQGYLFSSYYCLLQLLFQFQNLKLNNNFILKYNVSQKNRSIVSENMDKMPKFYMHQNSRKLPRLQCLYSTVYSVQLTLYHVLTTPP